MKNSSVLILCSGGIDSTALISFYISRNYSVNGLHIQYGQRNAIGELKSAQTIANYYSIPLSIVNLGINIPLRNREYICRNALFVLNATLNLPDQTSIISMGIHKGTPYYDCSQRFLVDCQNVLDGYFSGTVILEAPFANWSKQQIYQYCFENKVPLDLTHSCEDFNEGECGVCPSCVDRRLLVEITRNLRP